MEITGTIMGYDPGGNSNHGIAFFSFSNGKLISHDIYTLATAQEVIEQSKNYNDILAIGIDTLTCWSTGHSRWRPADRWLRNKYHAISQSIASSNSLYGSMGINGMSVLISMREDNPVINITETHPKVLYHALTNEPYDYNNNHIVMDNLLSNRLKTTITTRNDHEWDAAISVYAAINGMLEIWRTDLHQISSSQDEKLITPCGKTNYWWPQ